MKIHTSNRRCSGISLASALMLVLLAWLPAAAGSSDGPALSRAEQTVIHGAQQAMAAKQYTKAQKLLAEYIERSSGKAHYLVAFSLGNAWMLDGKPERALAHYQAASEGHGADATVWQNLGKAYYELARFGEAADCLAKAHASTTAPSPPLAYQTAVAYLQAKRPADARPLLERIVAEAEGSPDPAWLEALLKVYLDLGQKDKALSLARDLVRRRGQDSRLWQMLAHLYVDRQAYAKAAAAMEIKLSLAEASREEIENLGDLYRMAGVPLKAAGQYEKLLTAAVRPKDFENAAAAYIAARRVDTAIDVLQRGLDRYPTSRLWWLLAGAYYDRKNYEKAMAAFDQCTRYDPQHAQAHLMMGYCALCLERLPAAEAAFTRAAAFPRQRAEAVQRLKQLRKGRFSVSMHDATPIEDSITP